MILPRPAPPFEWTNVNGRPALICRPLAGFAPHFFATRHWPLGEPGAPADGIGWDAVAAALDVPTDRLVRARQVHGAAVAVARPQAGALPEADAIVSGDGSLVIGIQVADCIPILLGDPVAGAVAAVHAGWRGLALGTPRAAVETMTRTFGAHPRDLVAAIGPSIGPCCYQVGPDVRDRFSEAGQLDPDGWFRDEPAVLNENPPMPGLEASSRPDRWFFDTWACATAQLVEAGLDSGHIFNARLCTASHPDVFCSYRRDGRAAGRLAAAIRSAAQASSESRRA